MKRLLALLGFAGKKVSYRESYEDEAMFAGWVDLPPQLRVQKAEPAPAEPVSVAATAAQVFVLPPAAGLQ